MTCQLSQLFKHHCRMMKNRKKKKESRTENQFYLFFKKIYFIGSLKMFEEFI